MAGTLAASITPISVKEEVADPAFTATGTLATTTLIPVIPKTAAFTAAGALTATSTARHTRTAALAGAGVLAASGSQKYAPTAELAGAGALSATATAVAPVALPSLKATGTWSAPFSAETTPALVGTPAAGDRYFLWVTYKSGVVSGALATCQVAGWTEVAEYANGVVNNSTGAGSVKVACYYKDWAPGDGNPTIDLSFISGILGFYVMQLWQKSGGTWGTPTFVKGPRPSGGTLSTAVADSPIAVPSNSVVFLLIGLSTGSLTISRTDSAYPLADQTLVVGWSGAYVESPVAHAHYGSGNKMAADLGHRFVTTGATANNLVGNLTTTSSNSGSALWVIQPVI